MGELDAFLPKVPWGWTERIEPIEEFDYTCHRCKRHERCERMLVSRHRTVFGHAVSRAGEPRDVVRCTRCGFDMHPRDVTELVSPQLQDLYVRARAEVQTVVDAAGPDRIADVAARADRVASAVALRRFGHDASRPVAERLLADIVVLIRAKLRSDTSADDLIAQIGAMLLLNAVQIEAVRSNAVRSNAVHIDTGPSDSGELESE